MRERVGKVNDGGEDGEVNDGGEGGEVISSSRGLQLSQTNFITYIILYV